MKNLKSHFKFNKQERNGIFFLLLIIVLLQCGHYALKTLYTPPSATILSADLQAQADLDSLKKKDQRLRSPRVYAFNPNYMTDYKGYVLGMGVAEIDRLHRFRAQGNFVNTAAEFQKVTQISDSLLKVIAPYFKFPEWTRKPRPLATAIRAEVTRRDGRDAEQGKSKEPPVRDLNKATAEELRSVKGIGVVLSKRIVKFRDRLGGFLTEEQLFDVYGLEPEVAEKIVTEYKVFNAPDVSKININTASVAQIASLVYIRFDVAREIVAYREANGAFSSLNELRNIDGFPAEKISRIALYLSL